MIFGLRDILSYHKDSKESLNFKIYYFDYFLCEYILQHVKHNFLYHSQFILDMISYLLIKILNIEKQ